MAERKKPRRKAQSAARAGARRRAPLPQPKREEAAPSFETWRQRLEDAGANATAPRDGIEKETARFTEMLKVLGTPMIDGPLVHFVYSNRQARQVAVTGEFTEWAGSPMPMTQIGDCGIFHASREFPKPVRVEYKLIVDGKWIEDPFCPNQVDNGVGGRNSYFVVGDFAEPAELEERRGVAKGRVEEFDFTSKLLANTRRVYVYLPPNYQLNTKQRFAVLLVHDGGEYLNRAKLGVVLDNLGASGDIPRLIAVMVDPVDRTREYRADEDYARFVEQELLPQIDRTYRTLTGAGSRAVMGASLGGLISVYLGLTRPQLFSKVGGQSSVLMVDSGRLAELANKLATPLSFYFDV
ncbi:MAG TPA: alpha/beta hydrolase-fold protein, partial [Candidatus Binataceae bacterium]|nr:alpha/beta hydrolase-fold protein [Candidatus Binataceae bacterium]